MPRLGFALAHANPPTAVPLLPWISAGLYIALNAGLRSSILRICFAYVIAASLGTGLEILELLYDQITGTQLTSDTAWDLLANTTGALLAAVALELGLRLRTHHSPPNT